VGSTLFSMPMVALLRHPGHKILRACCRESARKRLNPYVSIIRLWGVLKTYRPPGQTSWSRALVRHGADARVALAAVLGLLAEDILVRDCSG
jgi:hypothetical protein